jgi:uncharacterized repeat protein (TIGR01451 family)
VVLTTNNAGGTPAAICNSQKINNTAVAYSDNTDPVNDTGDYTCTPGSYTLVKNPKHATYNLGDNVSFTMVVTSTGPGPAANVALNDPLPTLGNLNSWTITSNPGGCTINSNTLNCQFGTLANGQSRTVTVATNAPSGADLSGCPGGQKLNNIATLTGAGLPTLTDTGDYTCTAQTGKSITIGPSSMEGAIRISAGDWVNGGYSFQTNFTGPFTIAGSVSITGKCIGGTQASDTLVVPLGIKSYNAVSGADWLPTGDANSILSWEGSVVAPPTLCGGNGGQLDGSKGAVFSATMSGVPTGGLVTYRFKFRDPAAKGKPNTNCLDATDPNRNKADVCGASWSETKHDP